mgnify:CR=1 FL=1
MKIEDPNIAMESFDHLHEVKVKIDYDKWVETVETNLEYFTWLENTEEGKNRMARIDEIPEKFQDKIRKIHSKSQALAEYDPDKGFHLVRLAFNSEYGTIGTTYQKEITKDDLNMLLMLANKLNALLLNNGNQIITPEFVETYKS